MKRSMIIKYGIVFLVTIVLVTVAIAGKTTLHSVDSGEQTTPAPTTELVFE